LTIVYRSRCGRRLTAFTAALLCTRTGTIEPVFSASKRSFASS